MSERLKTIIWLVITVPSTLILMYFNPLAGIMFCIGLMVGSLVEKTGFNDSHLRNKQGKYGN
jgi:hypothetical protein